MKYQVNVKEVAPQSALVIRGKVNVAKAGETIGGILGRIGAFLGKQGKEPSGAPFTRTYSFENGVLEFEAGFPVPAGTAADGEIISTELPRGKVAVTMHVGSQETSPQAYEAIHAWMEANGKKPAGAPWEVYLSDEGTPEKDAQMQVFFPIQ